MTLIKIRIGAFTVMELVISLMISSIVIGIAYYSWLLVGRQFAGYNDRSQVINEYIMLNKALETDIDRAVLLRDSLSDVLCIQMKEESIQYVFNEDHVVRQGEAFADTFRLGVKNISFERVHDTLHAIKKLKMSVSLNGEDIEMIIQKNYSAVELMNAEKIVHE